MKVDPFAFLRGAAAIMAADLASGSSTGLRVQACGDRPLANFGSYATPEGTPVFDINDFDETLPAPFEWDLKRLAASLPVSRRGARMPAPDCPHIARPARPARPATTVAMWRGWHRCHPSMPGVHISISPTPSPMSIRTRPSAIWKSGW